MATKTKTTMSASPFDALAIENGVVILNNPETIDQAKSEPKKKTSSKKKAVEAQPEQPQEETVKPDNDGVQVQSIESYVNELNEREATVAAAEKALAEKEAELKATAEKLKTAAEMIKAAETNKEVKENKTMAEKKETTPAVPNLENLNMEELIKQQQAEFGKLTVKVETEDCWTQTKKGFCMGAGAAAGAGLVIGALSLIASCFGGGSGE